MSQSHDPLAVRIVTAPDVTCGGATWTAAVELLRTRLARRFGERVGVEQVPVFGPRFFEIASAVPEVAADVELPLVLVGESVVSRGGKLSETRIARALRDAGAEPRGEKE